VNIATFSRLAALVRDKFFPTIGENKDFMPVVEKAIADNRDNPYAALEPKYQLMFSSVMKDKKQTYNK
jgi:hypothetical protein